MKGYIAITTSIVLSLVLMVVAAALGSANLFSRSNYVDFNSKQTSYFIARSCLDHALLKLSGNSGYAGNEAVSISSYQCTISSVETSGENKIIKVRSQIGGSATNLKLTVKSSDLSTVSLEELVKF